MSNVISNQMLQVCLNPDDLIEKLSKVHFNNTNRHSGHIHFYFRGKSDHVIFLWSKGRLQKIIAKSPRCKKGQYIHWDGSQFSGFRCEDVLTELYEDIELVKIDDGGFNKSWSSFTGFLNWLLQD